MTILDFGLAAQLQQAGDLTQTKSGMFAGTPRYAAPEQMFGELGEFTKATDIYDAALVDLGRKRPKGTFACIVSVTISQIRTFLVPQIWQSSRTLSSVQSSN